MQKQIQAATNALKRMNPLIQHPLLIQLHQKYLHYVMTNLKKSIVNFDSAQPWLIYYYIHSLNILRKHIMPQQKIKLINHLKYTAIRGPPLQQLLLGQSTTTNEKYILGAFGGSYNQLPHLAPTYAAFLAIIQLGPQSYFLLNKQSLQQFFWRCKKGGNFAMHELGEFDLRAAFIVTIIVKLLRLNEALLEGVAETIAASQSYEGGISNTVGGQAHGGYTFCGVGALALLGQLHLLDIGRLSLWLAQRQTLVGGFNGRTNKLVDSCYSHWIGNIFHILDEYLKNGYHIGDQHCRESLYSQEQLENYILRYCQDDKIGGIRDKPGKDGDIYHTSYALSGLCNNQSKQSIKLQKVDPVYNVTVSKLKMMRQHFK